MTTSIRNANSTLMPLSNGRDAMRETERDIRSAYEEFMEKGDEETRKVLHETIMVFCNAKVRRLAHNAGGKVSPEGVEDVVNESCKAMLEGLDKHRSENEYIEKYNGLYQQCVQESICKFAEGAVQAEGSGNGEGYIPISLEKPNEDGTTLADNIESDSHYKPWDDARRQFAATALLIYVKAFLSLEVPPQSSLALFYARLLPHIRGSVDDNKTTSVSEAFRVMGKKTVETLGG